MTFRNKILLSIWSVVLSLLVITFFIINYWTRDRVENTFSRELRANYSTIRVLTELQAETLVRSCRVVAESPRLRAVAELGDPATALELAHEVAQTTGSRLFVVTDRHGKPLARLVEGKESRIAIDDRTSIRGALRRSSSIDVWPLGQNLYRVVSSPMLLDTELIGTLTIGFHITDDEIATLKRVTNSDIVLLRGNDAVISTLDSSIVHRLLQALPADMLARGAADTTSEISSFRTSGETYLGTLYRLYASSSDDSSFVSYLIVKPFSSEVDQSMGSILGTFGVISLLFLGLTTVIGVVISRGMARPVTELVRGTNEVSRGNYDYVIEPRGRDEISYLGAKFMEMSRSLKEKLRQLDEVNKDLTKRNTDLDETLQQLREAQEELVRNERLAATGKLTAQLAHEINNPIHNIQSCLQTALQRLPDESRGRELIEVAFEEVGRMSRLTRQMLEIYRSSYIEVQLETLRVEEVVRDTLSAMREELGRSNVIVHVEFDRNLPAVRGSRDKLKQVFINLLLNATDAMPDGGSIVVTGSACDGAVRIAVRDTGIGIPAENIPRIFDAFFTTKDKTSGVGLGLSVCYGVISQHNGSISVSSERGKGSTFIVTLPAESAL